MSSNTDVELITALRDGDATATERLFERYYAKVLNFCRSKVPSAAHDVTQQSFVTCFQKLDSLRDPAAFRGFLFAIVCNQIRMHCRKSMREGARFDFESVSSMDLDPTPSQIASKKSEHRLLLEGLRRIPLEYQMALELFYWEDMRAADIAEALAIPLGTAKTRIRRGRQLLEDAITNLDAPGNVLQSTITDLEKWARGLHEAAGS